jgi:hypothetical protein
MKDVCDRVVVYVMPSLSLCSSRLAIHGCHRQFFESCNLMVTCQVYTSRPKVDSRVDRMSGMLSVRSGSVKPDTSGVRRGSVLNTTVVDDYFRLLAYSRCKDSKERSLTLAVISTPQAREPTTLS